MNDFETGLLVVCDLVISLVVWLAALSAVAFIVYATIELSRLA